MYRSFGKRLLDIVAAGIGLILLSPVFLVICIANVVASPGNPLFVQERVGKNGRNFRMVKFRSMVTNASQMGKGHYFEGESDFRITKVGRILRKTSLDELPELVNVLLGNMSLVGPRPMLPYQYQYLSAEQRRRFEVAPGITGLAQVSGRNNMPWSKRIILDVKYIDNLSLWSDVAILFRTVTATVTSKGVDHSVTPEQVEDFIPSNGGHSI